MGNEKKDRFTKEMFCRLWWPSMVSSAGLAFGDMADAIVVGRKMGTVGLAAVSLCLPVYMVINVGMHSLGLGGSVRYSKYLGEGKKEEAVRNFNRILQAALLLSTTLAILGNLFLVPVLAVLGTTPEDGVLFEASRTYAQIIITGMPAFFLSYVMNYYLRNDDNQKLASFGYTIANGADILLSIVLVLFFDLDTGGAALATVAGQFVAIVIYLPGILGKKQVLRLKWSGWGWREVVSCFRSGFSTSVQYICQMVFLLIANNVLMNVSGEEGTAVFDMVQNASYLILYLYDGTAKAMQPLVSTYCGERNMEGSRRTYRLALRYGCAAGLFSSFLIWMFPEALCVIFGLTENGVMALCCRALRIFTIGGFLGGLGILIESYEQACEREKNAFVLAWLRGAGALIPCTILCSFCGLEYFWWLFPVTELVSLAGFLLWKRVKKEDENRYDLSRVYNRMIENKDEDLMALTQEVETFSQKWGADTRQIYFVTMTVEEICLAIMQKAFARTARGYIQLTLIALEDGGFELHIRDNAVLFNPFSLKTKKINYGGEYDMDAMGMLVIRQKAKDFFYRQYQGFNSLVVRI